MTSDINSVCTYCGVGCDITAVVQNNKIQKIYAQSDGYVSRGKLCIKGRYGFDFVHSPNRISKPRIKKEFVKKNFEAMPRELKARSHTLKHLDEIWYEASYEFATSLVAWKLVVLGRVVKVLLCSKNLQEKLCKVLILIIVREFVIVQA